MEKIALPRLTNWLRETCQDFGSGIGNLLIYGAVSLLLLLGSTCLSMPLSFLDMLVELPVSTVLSWLLSFIIGGIIACGLCGVALARLHGREAEMRDYWQDLGAMTQAMIGNLVAMVAVMLALYLPFLPFGYLAWDALYGGEVATSSLILTGLLGAVIGVPLWLMLAAMTMFVIPLIVDKRLDFWSALLQSVDCARRDLPGLMLLALIIYPAFGFLAGCTCGVGMLFAGPFFYSLIMRAYSDYFGIELDRYRPLQIVGYSNYGDQPEVAPCQGRGFKSMGDQMRMEQEQALQEALGLPPLPPPLPPPAPPQAWQQLKVPPLPPKMKPDEARLKPMDGEDEDVLKMPPPPPTA